jgi:hypothetical protein
MKKSLVLLYALLGIAFHHSACKGITESREKEVANLSVQITEVDSNKGSYLIQAQADHAIRFELIWINGERENISNEEGSFSLMNLNPGNYTFDIKAFGKNERFLRVTRTLQVGTPPPIPLDKGYQSAQEYEGYTLLWADEFEGNQLNPQYWVHELGNGCPNLCGWGNNELQFYRAENTSVGEGVLTITAKEENWQGFKYTSSRIKTQNLLSFRYGRIDARALLPKGQGIWPAIWMLGSNIGNVGWPTCGEIDIMELIGGSNRENTVHGTVHWNSNGHASAGGFFTKAQDTFADEYHVFSIVWDENRIIWLVNDQQYYQINIAPPHMHAFREEFFFLINLAVGGNWPGNPNASTSFDQTLKVDYIRVFQRQ